MLNAIFIVLIAGAVMAAAFNGTMNEVTDAGISSAKAAVDLCIGLIGQMAVWLGFMRIIRDAGLMQSMAKVIGRVLQPIFPDIPLGHPAMGAMLMNIAANVLGLANAATPFGLKAMRELNRLNQRPGVATNSMALFLAINTSGVAVMPLGVIAVRAAMESNNAAGIVLPSMLATMCSTMVAIIIAKSLENRALFAPERAEPTGDETPAETPDDIAGIEDAEEVASLSGDWSMPRLALMGAFGVALVVGLVNTYGESPDQGFAFAKGVLSSWLLPVLMSFFVLIGFSRRVRVYESFVRGAKEGFEIAVMIIPFLVAILVAIGMFRASGLMDVLIGALTPITSAVGIPAEVLPMALIRPLSGSGAFGVMTETMKAYGPDSFIGFCVSVMNGSTETTFYVLAVYFGSVGVRAARHTVFACLAADFVGFIAAVFFARMFF